MDPCPGGSEFIHGKAWSHSSNEPLSNTLYRRRNSVAPRRHALGTSTHGQRPVPST